MTAKQQKTCEPIQDLEGEVWKPIKGYEGLYEVSNMGRVLSLSYMRTNKKNLIKQKNNKGYLSVVLSKKGKTKHFNVHRLVYEAFKGKIPEYNRHEKGEKQFVINHLDENKHNNRIENLELTNQRKNNNWGTRIERAAKAKSKKVYQYTLDWKLVKVWSSLRECGENGFSISCISSCCSGKIRYYKRFLWRYKEETDTNKKSVRHRNKPVAQYDKNGNIIQTWESVNQTKHSGFNNAAVYACCAGKKPQYKGYIWKFI